MNRYAEVVSPLRAHFSRLRYFAVKPFHWNNSVEKMKVYFSIVFYDED